MIRIYELRQKEVININDGCRFGYICDVEIDITTGKILALIVPGPGRILGLFGREKEYKIPWKSIKQIGDDIIIVDIDSKSILIECS